MISFVNNKKTASIDTILNSPTVSDLSDYSRKQINKNILTEGTRVIAYTNNGLITPSGYPKQGTKGTIVSIPTMSGRKTAMDESAFVRWDGNNKVCTAPLTHLKLASKKVANLNDYYLLQEGIPLFSNNNSLLTHFAQSSVEDVLVHKSSKDLWSLKVGEDGSYDIERLFDDNGEPLKV